MWEDLKCTCKRSLKYLTDGSEEGRQTVVIRVWYGRWLQEASHNGITLAIIRQWGVQTFSSTSFHTFLFSKTKLFFVVQVQVYSFLFHRKKNIRHQYAKTSKSLKFNGLSKLFMSSDATFSCQILRLLTNSLFLVK